MMGVAVGFVGVVLVSLPSLGEGEAQAGGVVLVICATLCYGVAVNIATPIQQKYGSLPVTLNMLGLATVWTMPYAFSDVLDNSFSWPSFLAVLAAGVLGTGAAYALFGELVGTPLHIHTYIHI